MVVEGSFGLAAELKPQLLGRYAKYGSRVEVHLFLVERGPGKLEYLLRDYLLAERRWQNAFFIPEEMGAALAKDLRKSHTPPRRRARRS